MPKLLAQIYAESHPTRVVIQLERPIAQLIVDDAIKEIGASMRVGGTRFDVDFVGTNTIEITGKNRRHTPAVLLKWAKSLATQLGCEVKMVAPPR